MDVIRKYFCDLLAPTRKRTKRTLSDIQAFPKSALQTFQSATSCPSNHTNYDIVNLSADVWNAVLLRV